MTKSYASKPTQTHPEMHFINPLGSSQANQVHTTMFNHHSQLRAIMREAALWSRISKLEFYLCHFLGGFGQDSMSFLTLSFHICKLGRVHFQEPDITFMTL